MLVSRYEYVSVITLYKKTFHHVQCALNGGYAGACLPENIVLAVSYTLKFSALLNVKNSVTITLFLALLGLHAKYLALCNAKIKKALCNAIYFESREARKVCGDPLRFS